MLCRNKTQIESKIDNLYAVCNTALSRNVFCQKLHSNFDEIIYTNNIDWSKRGYKWKEKADEWRKIGLGSFLFPVSHCRKAWGDLNNRNFDFLPVRLWKICLED